MIKHFSFFCLELPSHLSAPVLVIQLSQYFLPLPVLVLLAPKAMVLCSVTHVSPLKHSAVAFPGSKLQELLIGAL